jgi:hypothetical protein
MNPDTKYNGWTNYATWRVNLEMFDGLDPREMFLDEVKADSAYDLSKQLEEYADNVICDDANRDSGWAIDYARAFLADVNWYEIAEHMLDDIKAEEA